MWSRVVPFTRLRALAVVLGVTSCVAPGAHDDLGDVEQATFLGSLGTLFPTASGTTRGRTNDFRPTCVSNSTAPDVSYTWTAPWTGTFSFTTTGSTFDTVLEIRRADDNTVSLGCNNDNGTVQSTVTVSLTAGQAVRIVIDGFGSASGNYILGITPSVPIPPASLDLWLRADTGVVASNGGVTQWLDQSGRGRNASASGSPVLVTGGPNGRSVVRFEFGESMRISASLPTRYSLFVVGKNAPSSPTMVGEIFPNLFWLGNSGLLVSPPGSGNLEIPIGPVDIYHAFSLRYDGAALGVVRDGAFVSSFGFSSTMPWQFGSEIGGLNLQSDIAEIIIYERVLSDVEQLGVSMYLRNKYALPLCGDGTCSGWETAASCPNDC